MSKDTPTAGFILGDLLNAVYWIDESLQVSLTEAGYERVSRTWSMIFLNIANGVTRPIKIAANVGVSRQAMHKTLEEMQSKGLVEIYPDPNDKRATAVRFSARATALQLAAIEALQHIEGQLVYRIGKKRLTALKDALGADWGDLVHWHPDTSSNS